MPWTLAGVPMSHLQKFGEREVNSGGRGHKLGLHRWEEVDLASRLSPAIT
jgi:hypothetical protein